MEFRALGFKGTRVEGLGFEDVGLGFRVFGSGYAGPE